ncbi:MAG: type II toxin-antitoxin system death-on-curing family toxin [Verrucomicrobiales bacterium]|nr:type II toxin-antitoxin system death-on-curing family toxin [Verrucomicrobiales bacterium]
MKEPRWVLNETVKALNESLLGEFGGLGGIRDEGLLESAMARPLQLHSFRDPDLFELAAAYAYGLVRNYPFLDGNKRTGFTAAVLFLELNGCRFGASEIEATVKTLALAACDMSEAEYAKWLEANSVRR